MEEEKSKIKDAVIKAKNSDKTTEKGISKKEKNQKEKSQNAESIENLSDLGLKVKTVQKLLNNVNCGMLIADSIPDGQIIYANDTLYGMIQYTREEYHKKYGYVLSRLIPDDEKQRVKALIYRQISAGGDIKFEFQAERKDRSRIWLKISMQRVVEGKESYYLCTIIDFNYTKVLLDESYKSKKELDIITNSIPGGVMKLRMDDFYIKYANDGFYRIAGYSRMEYATIFMNRCDSLIYPDDMKRVQDAVKIAIDNKGNVGIEYRIISKSGEVRWSYANGTRVDDEDGDLVYLFIIMDITARKKVENELTKMQDYISSLSKSMRSTFWLFDVKTRKHIRMGSLENTYSEDGQIYDPFNLYGNDAVHPDDFDDFSNFYNRLISTNEYHELVVRLKNENGLYYPVRIYAKGDEDEENGHDIVYGFTRVCEDEIMKIKKDTRHTKDENRLIQIAKSARADMKDRVTGLLSYSSFIKKAEKMLNNKEEGCNYALMCTDINEFHRYNQHYGFSRSNALLRNYAKTLKKVFKEDGIYTRVDGDYFVLLFKYADHKDLLQAMTSLHDEIEIEQSSGTYISFDTCIGIYIAEDNHTEIIEMLEYADLARRSIKGLKGNHYAIYTENIKNNIAAEEDLVEEIRDAMNKGSMEIRYLPRIKDEKFNIVGCKAIPTILLGNGKIIEHDKILRLLEGSAKLEDVGLMVLSEVANNLGAWKSLGNEILPVSMVFSSAQFSSPNVVKQMRKIVEISNIETSDFIIEIPEKYFADSTQGFENTIRELDKAGFKVIISRFGSYNMNVSALRTLPISGIKFHGEYFNDYMTNEKDKIFISKIVEMCKDVGLEVYCGNINTKLQEKFAREIGCQYMEGDGIHPSAKPRAFEKVYLGDSLKRKK
ncbi:MAG: EAL domain-containing protein [Lachnospiraceae bacterium]|nr:EAL domain-containing protein [Lachnospiraceae bacterium]